MRRILMIGPGTTARAERAAMLSRQKMQVFLSDDPASATDAAVDVVVLDASGFDEAALDEQLARLTTAAPLLVLHDPPRHGETPLRERRSALIRMGASDTMRTEDPVAELLTRVTALLLRKAPPRVLIVEDQLEIAAWAAEELRAGGHDATTVGTLAAARAAFAVGPVDVLVVDRMLPDGDGLDLIRDLRSQGIRTPILVYSALRDGADWIQGRRAGADDYVGKPIDADELRARVHFVLRPEARRLIFGPMELVLDESRLLWRGEPAALSDRGRGGRVEFALLAYLAERHDLKIPIRMLLQDLWNQPYANPESNPVYTAKRRLANRLRDLGIPDVIVTEDGTYRFDPAPLLALESPSATAT